MKNRLCLVDRLLVLVVLFTTLVWALPVRSADLTLYIQKRDAGLHVRAVSAWDKTEFEVAAATGVVAKLEQIYDLIERRPEPSGTLSSVGDFMEKQYRTVRDLIPFWKDDDQGRQSDAAEEKDATLNRLLDETGTLLLDPIQTQMAVARSIDLVVTHECLFYPFDAVHLDHTPLFLKKCVAYRLSERASSLPMASASWRGVIIADERMGTQRGVGAVSFSFPGSFAFDAEHVRSEDISRISSADFVLVSADGGVNGIKLNHLVLRPETLSRLNPQLVYFDCNLYGLNQNFLNHFDQTGIGVYVAPIFSRETPEASAETMVRFFQTLRNGEDPCDALYLARKILYDSLRLDGADELTAIRGAFPLRVYLLN